MNKSIAFSAVLVTFLTIAGNVLSDAGIVIKKNVESANAAYDKITTEQPSRLWIHVRTQKQMVTIQTQEVSAWLGSIRIGGKEIDVRPIQLVDNGPKIIQLRFFFKQNKNDAEQLLNELKKGFPLLGLEDFSGQYENILEPGHYELWLTPDATLLTHKLGEKG